MKRQSNEIKDYILRNIETHPKDISRVTAQHFGASRQAISNHLKRLTQKNLIVSTGNTKAREYKLTTIFEKEFLLPVTKETKEDVIWRDTILPFLKDLPKNVLEICQFGFTEILNNVIDHSESKDVFLAVTRTAVSTELTVLDSGVGIFNKVQKEFGLSDPRHALLELSKGNLTSMPKRHSGQGVFYTSHMFDYFCILSGLLYYSATMEGDDWLIEADDKEEDKNGTYIKMRIYDKNPNTYQAILDKYNPDRQRLTITKTHVPIKLARYKGEQLVSRSQAKRLLARFQNFSEVMLDFQGIEAIGPAFADEIFRVYKLDNPGVDIVYINTNAEVLKTIQTVIVQPPPLL